MKSVEVYPVWLFRCPKCNKLQKARTCPVELTPEECDELRIDWESRGDFVAVAKRVRCRQCRERFRTEESFSEFR